MTSAPLLCVGIDPVLVFGTTEPLGSVIEAGCPLLCWTAEAEGLGMRDAVGRVTDTPGWVADGNRRLSAGGWINDGFAIVCPFDTIDAGLPPPTGTPLGPTDAPTERPVGTGIGTTAPLDSVVWAG